MHKRKGYEVVWKLFVLYIFSLNKQGLLTPQGLRVFDEIIAVIEYITINNAFLIFFKYGRSTV